MVLLMEVCYFVSQSQTKPNTDFLSICLNSYSNLYPPTDTDYISEEEKQKVELMLTFLTEESKQAAASTAVSNVHCHQEQL